jgi:hypothetical protein
MKQFYFLLLLIYFCLLETVNAQDSFLYFTHEQTDTHTVVFQWDIPDEQPLYYVLETYNYPFAINDWFPYADIEGSENSYRLRNIPIGTQSYRLRVIYENDILLSDSISFTIAPYKFLQSYYSYSPNESGKVSIHWKVSGISPSYYKLVFNNIELIIPDSIDSYDFYNLTANSVYTYNLTAVYSNNEELYSGNQLLSVFDANLSSIVRDSIQVNIVDTAAPSKLLWSYHYYEPNQSEKVSICWKPLGISPAYYQLTFNGMQLILPDSILKYDFLDLAADTMYNYTLTAFDANNQQLQVENQSVYIPRMNNLLQIPIDSIRVSRSDSASMKTNSISPIMSTSTQNITSYYYPSHILSNINIYICESNRMMLVWNFPEEEGWPRTELHYIFRNDECIAILPGSTLAFIDGPLPPGRYVYKYLNFSVNGDFMEWPLAEFVLSEHTPPYFNENFNINITDYYLTGNNAVINWTSEGEQGIIFYNIFRNNECIDRISNDAREYIDKDLPPGVYRYSVWATTHMGQWVEAENALYFNVTRVPLSPTNFTYTIQNDTNVKLTWNMSFNGLTPTYYQIQRNGVNIATISGSTLTYTDQSLAPGNYTYRLFAHYNTGEVLEAGNQITLTIEPITYAEPKYFSYDIDNRNIFLFWDLFSGDIEPSSYKIERNGNFITDVPFGVSFYYDTTAGFGTHYYRLFAYYGNTAIVIPEDSLTVILLESWEPIITGDSIVFSQHIVFNIEPVFQLNYTSGDNSVNLTWEIVEGNNTVNHYKIERNGNFLFQVDGNTFSFVDAELEFGTYEYTVKAYYTDDSFLNHVARIVGRACLTLFSCE